MGIMTQEARFDQMRRDEASFARLRSGGAEDVFRERLHDMLWNAAHGHQTARFTAMSIASTRLRAEATFSPAMSKVVP
jgi:hypothetical protein